MNDQPGTSTRRSSPPNSTTQPAAPTASTGAPDIGLGRFGHRLWICTCGQAWRTESGPYEKTTWLWRKWRP